MRQLYVEWSSKMFKDNHPIDFFNLKFYQKKKKLTKYYQKTTHILAPQNFVIEIIYINVKFNLN